MDGDSEWVKAPKIEMGAAERANANSTSSDRSPEYRCTVSNGRPGTSTLAASLGPMNNASLGSALAGREHGSGGWDEASTPPGPCPSCSSFSEGVRARNAQTAASKGRLQEKDSRRE